MPKQLGLQVVVQPHAIGPFRFGTSVSLATGNQGLPGAFSITELRRRSPEPEVRVREYSRKIATEMLEMKGFLGFVAVTVGDRMITISA